MNIKNSWDKVSIADYFDYLEILESPNYTDFDKKIRILVLLAGVADDYFDDLLPKDIEKYFKQLDFLKKEPSVELKGYYQIGNVKYKLVKSVKEVSAGQFIDLETANSNTENRVNNLHISCSAVLLPCKKLSFIHKILNKTGLTSFPEVEKYGETPLKETLNNLLENMKVSDAFSISVFFCVREKLSSKVIKAYLEKQMKNQLKPALRSLKEMEKNPQMRVKVQEAQAKIVSMQDGTGLYA